MATEAQLIAALRQADQAGDHAGATRIAQIIAAQRGPAPVTAGGTVKSFGSGVLSGAAGLGASVTPGSPQGLAGMIDAGGKIAGMFNPGLGAKINAFRQHAGLQTVEEQQQGAGLYHAPQNGVEQVANVAGQMVPNAFLGLEGGAKALGGSVLRNVVAPTIGATVAPAVVKAAGGGQVAQAIAGVGGAVLGGAAPNALEAGANAARAAVLGRSQQVAPEIQSLAQTAMQKHGIPLRSDQIAAAGGDRAAGIRDSNLVGSNPQFQASQLAQKQAFTTAAGRTFGAEGPLTTDTMAAARAKLSQGFEAHAQTNGVAADPQLSTDLDKVVSQAKELGLSDNEQGAITGQVAKIKELAAANADTGVIPGAAYQSLTQSGSTLSKIMSAPHGSYGNLGGDIRTALSNAAARAGGPDAAAQLADLRSQWANMKTVEPLAEKAGPEGLISPALLQGRVNATFDNAAYGSGGDLKELGDIGQTFLKEPANSQTPARLLDKLKGPALSGGIVEAVNMGAHDPASLATAAAAAAGGYAVNKGLNALKVARSNNPVATASLLTHGAPVPSRILNALALQDPSSYSAQALIPGAIAAQNAFQPSATQ